MKQYDLVIVGGGISGMTAALVALKGGYSKVLIIERQKMLGGVLNQCIHNGFGKKLLEAELTGPEYTNLIEKRIKEYPVEIRTDTEVIDINEDKKVSYVNSKEGVVEVMAKAIVLATGCREKFKGNINIPINKYTGIYTVGSAQKIINSEGYLPGKEPIIVARSKWAVIVARRLIIEGAKVRVLIVQENDFFKFDDEVKEILDGFEVPIILNAEIIDIHGEERIKGIKVREGDRVSSIACDSLILSVGYFPETDLLKGLDINFNEKSLSPKLDNYMTESDGIFACGNLIYGLNALKEDEIDGIDAGRAVLEYFNY